MIIPRQHLQLSDIGKLTVKKFNESGVEVKPIYKKMPQQSHVNKLLHTAAAGNGVLEDLDGLLMPIKCSTMEKRKDQLSPQPLDICATAIKERTERNLWRNDEVLEMMFVMQEIKALEKLNDKQTKSENVFKDVEAIMRKNGFVKKSHLQIWTKWKFLKSTYMTSRRNGVVPRIIPREIYSELHQMISGSSECDTSTNGSINGDNFIPNLGSSSFVTGSTKSNTITETEEDKNLDMAHPIFGFRLGLVKNEPIDIGYENIDGISENNLLDEVPVPKASVRKEKPEKDKSVDKAVVVPQRGRGRPPKKLPWTNSTMQRTSTPTPEETNSKVPPLRVAPFAKATHTPNALVVGRLPPPLTVPPTVRPIRVANLSTLCDSKKVATGAIKLVQPQLVPKAQPNVNHSEGAQLVHLPKDICTQSGTASSTSSPSYPKLKQVTARKTPYSLRPERAIPDLDESFSPPPSPDRQRKLEEVPSISHLVMQTNGMPENVMSRKRRFDLPQTSQPIPAKLRKIPIVAEEELLSGDGDQLYRDEQMYGKVMQTAIAHLSTSLRETQTQMMKEFFEKQHDLLQKEHAFQLQQDRLIMETFHMQTQEIMSSVQDLVATIAIDKRDHHRRYTTKNVTTNGERSQEKQNVNPTFVNAESSQEIQDLQYQSTEVEQGGSVEVGHYTDNDKQFAVTADKMNEETAYMEEDMLNLSEASEQTESEEIRHERSIARPDFEEDDDGDDDDDDDDDDDEEESDDDDDESDSDDGDEDDEAAI